LQTGGEHNTKELLGQIAVGSETAFAELFRLYHPKIYEVGMMLTRSHELAEELVQDVFLKIWLIKDQLPGINDFPSYLFIMARNRAYLTLRRKINLQKITAGSLSSDMPAYSMETEEQIIYNDYRKLAEQAISRLPVRQQEVYRLSKLQGLKREEVAVRLGIQPATVKEHLAKAVKNIRAFLMANSDIFPAEAVLVFSLWLQMRGN
jgi:RNA polymerase sigma-70 factor (ECF subfamily)